MRTIVVGWLIVGGCQTVLGQIPDQAPCPATPHAYAVVPSPLPPSPTLPVRAASPVSPAEKVKHLVKAADHLEAAGFSEKARELRNVAKSEEEALRARLKALQEEVRQLQPSVDPPAVVVHVKVVEIPMGKLRKLGFDFSRVAGHDAAKPESADPLLTQFGIVEANDPVFNVLLDALLQDGLLRVLAEPTLMTVSGRPAYLQVGAEVPRPVSRQDGTTSIEYENCGTRVDLVPIVCEDQQIRLELRVRVSSLDPERTIEVDGQSYPAMRVREMDTGIQLQSGQTVIVSSVSSAASQGVCPAARATTSLGKASHEASDDEPTAAEVADADGEPEVFLLVKPEIVTSPGRSLTMKCLPEPACDHVPPASLPAAAAASNPAKRPTY